MWHWLCHQGAGRSRRASKGLLLKAVRACWPKTNRLPAISLAMMGLFRIRRELKFRVSNHGKAHASPHRAREGERFYWGGEGSWRAIVKKESKAFHWLSPCQERKRVFLLISFAIASGLETSLSGLPTLFNWGFCLLIVYRPFLT